ncbi:Ribose-phosphate pyrophosphokinase [Mycobacteroides abscessus subsp. abscessus]|nr:Ribose-phosphate pyrophosphokinase [Mycobacteroides abscessus subsp. abscessus]
MTVQLKAWIPGRGSVINAAKVFKFPGGELHLKDIKELWGDNYPDTIWIADVRGADVEDLVAAALLADVARWHNQRFVLMLPYLPAARADRGVPLGADVYADLINAVNANEVIAIDPHSEAMPQWVRNVHVLNGVELVERAVHRLGFNGVIAPDAGAKTRAARIAEQLQVDLYQAEKKRDFDTGKLLSYKMADTLPASGKYLVVDDICDGGGTFKMLANETGLDASQLSLWVTHGIFSGQADGLKNYYRNIYTTDSHPGSARLGVATSIVPVYIYMLNRMDGFNW